MTALRWLARLTCRVVDHRITVETRLQAAVLISCVRCDWYAVYFTKASCECHRTVSRRAR